MVKCADRRPSKVISKALSASFPRLDHRRRPRPVGSRLMIARYTHFSAAASVGKGPRALTALRIRALMDSMVICSPVVGQGCELLVCGVDGVRDVLVALGWRPVSRDRLLSNRDVGWVVCGVVAGLSEGMGELVTQSLILF